MSYTTRSCDELEALIAAADRNRDPLYVALAGELAAMGLL
jgi:hypothetical protein